MAALARTLTLVLAVAAALAVARGQTEDGGPAPLPPNWDSIPKVSDAPAAAAAAAGAGANATLATPGAAVAAAAATAAAAAAISTPAAGSALETPVQVKFSKAPPRESRMAAIRARVAADKAAFAAAAADPDAAFDQHVAALRAQASSLAAAGAAVPPNAAAVSTANAAVLPRYRAAFKANLQDIAALNNASGSTLAFGITPFTHLPKDEFAALYLTGKRAPAAAAAGSVSAQALKGGAGYTCVAPTPWASTPFAGATPLANIDWRTSSPAAVTPIRNQGQCGSCVVFANTAALEAAFILKYNSRGYTASNVDLSEQDSMECTAGNACSGANGYEYIDRAVCKGVTYETSVPYRAVDTNSCPAVTRYISGVTGYAFVRGNIDDVRRALSHNVVAVGVAADTAGFQNYRSGIYNCVSSGSLNHEIALVAYTDRVSVRVGTSSQVWKVFTAKNSWGSGWGESGFVRFRADCASAGALSMYSDAYLTVPIRG